MGFLRGRVNRSPPAVDRYTVLATLALVVDPSQADAVVDALHAREDVGDAGQGRYWTSDENTVRGELEVFSRAEGVINGLMTADALAGIEGVLDVAEVSVVHKPLTDGFHPHTSPGFEDSGDIGN